LEVDKKDLETVGYNEMQIAARTHLAKMKKGVNGNAPLTKIPVLKKDGILYVDLSAFLENCTGQKADDVFKALRLASEELRYFLEDIIYFANSIILPVESMGAVMAKIAQLKEEALNIEGAKELINASDSISLVSAKEAIVTLANEKLKKSRGTHSTA
jgi:hypothetical protein